MKRFWRALKAGSKAMGEPEVAERMQVAAVRMRCDHCRGESFRESSAQLNTAGMTFIGLDWANRSARVFVCSGCGQLKWFVSVE